MRDNIHPNYVECTVTCACGNTFVTRSTKPVIRLEICSNCHPFITGKQKLMDAAGRVERFNKRFVKTEGKTAEKKAETKVRVIKKSKGKILSTSPIKRKHVAKGAGVEKKAVKKEEKKAN